MKNLVSSNEKTKEKESVTMEKNHILLINLLVVKVCYKLVVKCC